MEGTARDQLTQKDSQGCLNGLKSEGEGKSKEQIMHYIYIAIMHC